MPFFHHFQEPIYFLLITAMPANARINKNQPNSVFLLSSKTAPIRMLIRIVQIHPKIFIVFTIPFASLRHKHDYENVPTLLFTFPYKCPILYIEQQYTTEHEKRSGEAFFDPVSLYVSSSFQVQTSGTLSPDS